jgi:hypothetical protein
MSLSSMKANTKKWDITLINKHLGHKANPLL